MRLPAAPPAARERPVAAARQLRRRRQCRQARENYIIGALDEITVFVWRNPELGANVQVRPDGRITTPLITDMVAVGKTPAQLADDIRQALSNISRTRWSR